MYVSASSNDSRFRGIRWKSLYGAFGRGGGRHCLPDLPGRVSMLHQPLISPTDIIVLPEHEKH